MRYLFVPDELTIPSLLTMATPSSRDFLRGWIGKDGTLARGSLEGAIETLALQQESAWEQEKRYTFAMAGLLRVALLRRQCRWADALGELERIIPWLETRNDLDARYNETLARYLKGLLYYQLHAEEKARTALLRAMDGLRLCQEDWSFRVENEKFALGAQLLHWIEALVEAQEETPPLSHRALVPLYLPPVDAPRFELRIVPLGGGELTLRNGQVVHCVGLDAACRPAICPLCTHFYFALETKEGALPIFPPALKGDFLVMRWEGDRPLRVPDAFKLRSFRRYPDGHIVWTSEEQPALKISGIPVMLCRIEE